MLHTLCIERFRGFERFEMNGLGRINLLVGTNNCGKTSVLEAVQLLASHGEVQGLSQLLWRRGERPLPTSKSNQGDFGDARHLFNGHNLERGSRIGIMGLDGKQKHTVELEVLDPSKLSKKESQQFERTLAFRSREGLESESEEILAFRIKWSGPPAGSRVLPLDENGAIPFGDLRLRRRRFSEKDESPSVRFITTESLSARETIRLFESVVLTEEEELLLQSLRTIEPDIARIASTGLTSGGWLDTRGGLLLRVRGRAERIPIGSMGDGIWRLLGIALSLVDARGGTLLIDEIDTGLHYTVMTDMWKLLLDTARRLDVQVFATTHSRDCYESLAEISREDVDGDTEISIQRIEKGQTRAVAFAEPEIVIAARQALEVR